MIFSTHHSSVASGKLDGYCKQYYQVKKVGNSKTYHTKLITDVHDILSEQIKGLSKDLLDNDEIMSFIGSVNKSYHDSANKLAIIEKRALSKRQKFNKLKSQLDSLNKEKEETLAKILDPSPASIALIDKDYKYKFVNKKYLDWWHAVDRSQFVGKSVEDIFGAFTSFSKIKENLDRSLNGTTHSVINHGASKANKKLYYSTTYAPSYSITGDIDGAYIYAIDITEIKEHEQKVIESEEMFRTMLDSSPVGISIIDQSGNTIRHSESGAKVFGYTVANELTNSSLQNFIHPDSFQAAFDDLNQIFNGKKKNVSNTYKCSKKDGSIIYCDFKSSLLEHGTYKNHAIIGFSDVTERTLSKIELENKNQQLEEYIQSNIRLEQFAHIASHDLKSPLRTVSSFTGLLKSKLNGRIDDKELQYLNFIESGAKKMSDLINDLLEYSTANAQTLNCMRFNVNNAIQEVMININFALKESDASIELLDVDREIIADWGKFKQILQNLITNAIKFVSTDSKPEVKIVMTENPTHWVFSIIDNGIGIDQKNRLKIFEAFQRLHTQTEYEGTGLGLSICYTLVDKHGGEMWVESTVGEGSTFNFSILKNLEVITE